MLIKSAETSSETTHTLQTIVLGDSNADITQMILYGTGSSAYVYIGTSIGIYRVSGPNCDYYTDCCSCIAARDPYCAFDTSKHRCTEINDDNRDSPYLIQDVANGNSTLCLTGMNVNTTENTMSEPMQSPTSTALCSSTNIKGTDSITPDDTTATTSMDGTTQGGTEYTTKTTQCKLICTSC